MPQDLADFGQRGAAAQHLGRQRVTKLMGARRRSLDAGALERMPNDRSNGTLAQKAADGSLAAQKHATAGAARAAVAQVRRDRRADLRREGKGGSLTAFPSDAHLCRRPSQYRQARERPLHLNATPVARAAARSRSRAGLSPCVDRYWPATDGPGPPQSREGSRASTNWPRRERQQPNRASPLRDSARTAGRTATRWSGASRASDATAALGAGQIARHRRHSGVRA